MFAIANIYFSAEVYILLYFVPSIPFSYPCSNEPDCFGARVYSSEAVPPRPSCTENELGGLRSGPRVHSNIFMTD